VPAILDLARVDRILTVSTAEALDAAREAARRDGILCGPSGGAALAAARRLAQGRGLDPAGGPIVTVLPDLGERYLLRPGFIQAPPPRLSGGSS
jgi:cysteine synthase A